MTRLAGKIALITGGTSGIGRETARLFCEEGAIVIVTGVDNPDVASTAAELGVEALASDAADLTAIDALMAHIAAKYGRLDIIFANAGIGGFRLLKDMDSAYYDRLMNLNLRGPYFLINKALPLLSDGASIVLTASVAAHVGATGNTAYGASKAGIRSIVRGFAAELAPRGIRVNALTPGPIDTPLMDNSDMPREKVTEIMRGMVPMGRLGTVRETAEAVLFLASDASSFTTGGEIKVSGGLADL